MFESVAEAEKDLVVGATRFDMKLSKATTLVHADSWYSQINRCAASPFYRDSLFSSKTKMLVSFLSLWLPWGEQC